MENREFLIINLSNILNVSGYLASIYTVKPRPEAHMDMILFEVFLKNIHLIPQESDSTMTLSII